MSNTYYRTILVYSSVIPKPCTHKYAELQSGSSLGQRGERGGEELDKYKTFKKERSLSSQTHIHSKNVQLYSSHKET